MNSKRLIPMLVTAACALGAAPVAEAATEVQQASSQNWSGYVVESSANQNFSSVSGSWTQPTAKCSAGNGHAAFWVGLGGSGQTQALEQAGTEADCSGSGQPTDFAWYELVPAAPVRLDLAISPGDHVASTVSVRASTVSIKLVDITTGQSVAKTLSMASPDTSSAEWIAEAPSACDATATNCQPLALTDFGSVGFSNARATTADGHAGTISDSAWNAAAVTLSGSGPSGDIAYGTAGGGGATPTSLSSDGASFSVAYAAATASGGSEFGSSSNGYGGGSGYGGYGDGYGGSGYGGYGYGGYGYGGSGGYSGGGYPGAYSYGYGVSGY